MPKLLVVVLHQALLLSGFCLFTIHLSPLTHFPKRTIWHWLRPVLFYNFTFTLRWLIQQCHLAQRLWLPVTPFVNPLQLCTIAKLGGVI
jgi:hypothetical protein